MCGLGIDRQRVNRGRDQPGGRQGPGRASIQALENASRVAARVHRARTAFPQRHNHPLNQPRNASLAVPWGETTLQLPPPSVLFQDAAIVQRIDPSRIQRIDRQAPHADLVAGPRPARHAIGASEDSGTSRNVQCVQIPRVHRHRVDVQRVRRPEFTACQLAAPPPSPTATLAPITAYNVRCRVSV